MTRVWVARLMVLGILGIAAYGYWEGIPDDLVGMVSRGDVEGLKRRLARDPEAVHTKVYPQAASTPSARRDYLARTGEDPWQGRYLIHQAVEFSGNLQILDALADAGADLKVRRDGKTLLHLAAEDGKIDVATWLLEHGADLSAGIECDACPERGYAPLHSSLLQYRDEKMTELLLSRGATLEATGADGRTALHTAAARGHISGALVLVRHGADLSRPDGAGQTPHDLASLPRPQSTLSADELRELADWFKPDGKFAAVSAEARASRTTLGDEYARRLMDEVDAKAKARAAMAPASK